MLTSRNLELVAKNNHSSFKVHLGKFAKIQNAACGSHQLSPEHAHRSPSVLPGRQALSCKWLLLQSSDLSGQEPPPATNSLLRGTSDHLLWLRSCHGIYIFVLFVDLFALLCALRGDIEDCVITVCSHLY